MGFRLDKFALGFIVFSFFAVGFFTIFNSMDAGYDADIDISEFENSYNKINDTFTMSNSMKDDTLYSEIEGGEATIDSATKNSLTAIKNIFSLPSLISSMMHDFAQAVGISPVIIDFAMVALITMLVFSIVYMIFRFKG